MEKLPQEHNEGNQQEIVVLPKGKPERPQVVKVSDVLIGEADSLKKGLAERLDSPEVAERVFTWLRGRLPTTLTLEQGRNQAGQGQGRWPRSKTSSSRFRRAKCWPAAASR